MHRERDAHSESLLSKSEFLTLGQVSSLFFQGFLQRSERKGGGEPSDNDDLAAVKEEENFVTAKEFVLAAGAPN